MKCGKCPTKGYYIEKETKLCFACIGNCSKCDTTSSCKTCFSGFYLENEGLCSPKTPVALNFLATENAAMYKLTFSEEWPEFQKPFSESLFYFTLGFEPKISQSQYSISILKGEDERTYFLKFSFSTNVRNGTLLSINLEDPLSESKFMHEKLKVSIKMAEYIGCKKGLVYSPTEMTCLPIQYTKVLLDYSNYP